MNNLLPCPFCGKIPEIEELKYMDGRMDKYYVSCKNDKCACEPMTFAHKNKGVVTRAWNKRLPPRRTEHEIRFI